MKDYTVIKYTLMPFNEDDDYEYNFDLSLREFAKALKDKTLLAPFIVYNSELDVPMESELEDYTAYCTKDQIESVVRKQEMHDPIRTLILHGFDISLDELRNTYLQLAKRNGASLCVNIIADIEVDSNITIYLDEDIDKEDDEEWEEIKEGTQKEINKCVEDFKNGKYDDDYYSLDALFESLMNAMEPNSSNKSKSKEENKNNLLIPLPKDTTKLDDITDEEIDDDIITFSYERNKSYLSFSSVNNELFILDDDDNEIVLSQDQIDFILDSYFRIQDIYKNEPRK